MTTFDALLAAVRAAPDDDLPRLVLADHYEGELGQSERAEFIHVQCEIARLDMGGRQLPMGVGRERLFAREAELVRNNWVRWLDFKIETAAMFAWDELTATLELGCGHSWYTFSRGFVSRVSGPLAALYGGGRCGCCGGHGRFSDGPHDPGEPCNVCGGVGRVPGVLADLLRREPVGAVGIVVTDKEPYVGHEGAIWLRGAEHAADHPPHLPDEVFAMIQSDPHRTTVRLPTADAARLALSRALFAFHAPPCPAPPQ